MNPHRKSATCLLAILCLLLDACSATNENRSISDLIQHFKANGLNGDFDTKAFALIGAIDGGSYSKNGEFEIEVYKFDDPTKASNLGRASNPSSDRFYSNGYFLMLVHSGGDRTVNAFMTFK